MDVLRARLLWVPGGLPAVPALRATPSAHSAAAPSRSPLPLWPSPHQWPLRSRPSQAPPTSRERRSSCASASCTRARTPRWRSLGWAGTQPPAGGRSTPRWWSSREGASATRRRRGDGSSRCCWGSKESSPTRSRGCATAPCSPPTRWTRSRAPSRRCWRRPSAPTETAMATAAPRLPPRRSCWPRRRSSAMGRAPPMAPPLARRGRRRARMGWRRRRGGG